MDEIIHLGDSGLFGLLSRDSVQPIRGPVMVLINPGVIPRSGPFRLHMRLGRRLAERGIATFRFDLPGIGDTMPSAALTRLEAVSAALDAVQKHTGVSTFVLGGLCLGADLAWTAAVQDPRIVGLLQIDGLARAGYWFHFGWAKRRFPSLPLRSLAAIAHWAMAKLKPQGEFDRDWPAPGMERRQLNILLDRGVQLFALYTGGISDYFRDARQFAATFALPAHQPGVRFEFWSDCDHVFYTEADRLRLIQSVQDWYLNAFSPALEPTATPAISAVLKTA